MFEGIWFDALEFIAKSGNPFPIAGEAFDSKEDFLKFVLDFKEAGVSAFFVAGILDEEWRIKEEGGPIARFLILVCDDNCDWKKMMKLVHYYRPNEFKEIDENVFRLWWD